MLQRSLASPFEELRQPGVPRCPASVRHRGNSLPTEWIELKVPDFDLPKLAALGSWDVFARSWACPNQMGEVSQRKRRPKGFEEIPGFGLNLGTLCVWHVGSVIAALRQLSKKPACHCRL